MSRGQPPLRGLVNFTRVAFYSAPSIRTNNPSYYTLLSNRSLVAVKGPDATKLLHSIVTADMNARQNIVQYGMMLNAQGRVLYDVIIYSKGEDGHLLECDAMVVDDVVQHLKKFSLRSKVEISKTEDMKLWSFYQPLGGDWPQQLLESTVNGVHFCNLDPRVKALGLRTVTRLDTEASAIWTHLQLGSLEQYHQHRLKTGVPEGVAEIVPGSCFPLEFNLDYMNGVSFHKGCYLGQELTARTHHTGVVRKRVMPIEVVPPIKQPIPWGVPITTTKDGNPAGKLICCQGNSGLGLMRLEMLNESLCATIPTGTHTVTAHIPYWWPAV